jgi:hypothetical protein
MFQVVEHLTSKSEALSSNASTEKKKKKKEKKKEKNKETKMKIRECRIFSQTTAWLFLSSA